MITPRLSLFNADSWNYIYTQANTIGATTLSQTVNINKVNFHGIEGVLSLTDIYWHGLSAMTSATFTNSKILADSLAPWYVATKRPAFRASASTEPSATPRTISSRSPPPCASRRALS